MNHRHLLAVLLAALCCTCGLLLGVDELSDPQPAAGGGQATTSSTSSTTSSITDGDGGHAGSSSNGGHGGAPPDKINLFGFRRNISIDASKAALMAGHTAELLVDHAALVTAGVSDTTGNDLRIYRKKGSLWTEVPRVLAINGSWNAKVTRLHFPIEEPIASTDESYYLYYGSNSPPPPNDDRSSVYLIWLDFDGGLLQHDLTAIGTATGDQAVANSHLGVHFLSGDGVEGKSDNLLFFNRQLGDDAVIDVSITDVVSAAAPGGAALVGGVMLRATNDAGAPMVTVGLKKDLKRLWLVRSVADENLTKAGEVVDQILPAQLRLTRIGSKFVGAIRHQKGVWMPFPQQTVPALTGPLQVGIPVSGDTVEVTVEVDWYRMRRAVLPEPLVTLGSVEQGPFSDG